MQTIETHLVKNLQRYFEEHGFQKAVVGISGGVDSAVVTTLAVKALGKENVTGLILPHTAFSSAENMNDAKELGQILKIFTEVISIDNYCKPFQDLTWTKHHLTQANILARVRMVILYSWANEHQALVLGTCNRSETLLGYETKFGDGACDISVIGDLWKTEVWSMAKHLGLPEKFVTKAPSAELWAGHNDEEEMGFSYLFADEILKKWENGERLDENDEKVREILRRIKINEHKRQFPPTLSRKE